MQVQVQREVADTLDRSSRSVILGGDNSLSLGSIAACAGKFGKIGLVILDAHFDLRGKMGGKPTNGSSYGLAISSLKNELDPTRVVEIGVRGFVNSREYANEARQFGVTVFTPADVRKEGAVAIAQRAYEIAKKDVDTVYFSIDIDCVDIAQVCGVSAPSVGGLEAWEVNEMAYHLGRKREVVCSDFVELAPPLDPTGRLEVVAFTALLHLIAGFKMRETNPS